MSCCGSSIGSTLSCSYQVFFLPDGKPSDDKYKETYDVKNADANDIAWMQYTGDVYQYVIDSQHNKRWVLMYENIKQVSFIDSGEPSDALNINLDNVKKARINDVIFSKSTGDVYQLQGTIGNEKWVKVIDFESLRHRQVFYIPPGNILESLAYLNGAHSGLSNKVKLDDIAIVQDNGYQFQYSLSDEGNYSWVLKYSPFQNDGKETVNAATIKSDDGLVTTDGNGNLSTNSFKTTDYKKINTTEWGSSEKGSQAYDFDNNQPVWWDGSKWINSSSFTTDNKSLFIETGTPLSSENADSDTVKNATIGDTITVKDTQDVWQKIEKDNGSTWVLQVSPLDLMLGKDASSVITNLSVNTQRYDEKLPLDLSLANLYAISTGVKDVWMGANRSGSLTDMASAAGVTDLELASGYTFTWSSNAIGKTFFFDNIMGTFTFRVCGEDNKDTGLSIRAKIMCENESISDPDNWKWAYKDTTFILRMGDSLTLKGQGVSYQDSTDPTKTIGDVFYFAQLTRGENNTAPYIISGKTPPTSLTDKGYKDEVRLGEDGMFLCTKEGSAGSAQWVQYPSLSYLKAQRTQILVAAAVITISSSEAGVAPTITTSDLYNIQSISLSNSGESIDIISSATIDPATKKTYTDLCNHFEYILPLTGTINNSYIAWKMLSGSRGVENVMGLRFANSVTSSIVDLIDDATDTVSLHYTAYRTIG